MSKWQPIETIPKDGTHILTYMEKTIVEAWFDNGCSEWVTKDLSSTGCGCCGSENDEPTHWMPLPEPPEDNK